MDFKITPNGNLELFIENDQDREDIQTAIDRATDLDHGVLADIIETNRWPGNGMLYQVNPENVPGALTDAPMLTDELDYQDDGAIEVTGKLWWFPNYQVESWYETLLKEGRVIFTKADEA